MRVWVVAIVLVVSVAYAVHAYPRLRDNAAPTPPRGLNTWDAFRYWVYEDNITADANAMVSLGLVSLGWEYLVVDEGWFRPVTNVEADPLDVWTDGYSNFVPDPARFPSAGPNGKFGFMPLCNTLALKGLKCGVHLIMGIPIKAVLEAQPIRDSVYTAADVADRRYTEGVPAMNFAVNHSHPGAQHYYNGLVLQLASWGIRFIKFDFDFTGGADTKSMRMAIDNAVSLGYPTIVLSINGDGSEYSDMYRVTNDMWDVWGDVLGEFDTIQEFGPGQQPNNWADFDMLPLGRIGGYLTVYTKYTFPCTIFEINCQNSNSTSFRYCECCPRQSRLTLDEGRTLVTILCIGRSPLMIGGFLPETHADTLALLQNPEVLRVNSEGHNVSQVVYEKGNKAVWLSFSKDNSEIFVALFNLRDSTQLVGIALWEELGLVNKTSCGVRDLWARKELGPALVGYYVPVAPHASVLLSVHSCE